ncbi:hypothetical protein [Actinomadura rugatobispora]|uniref:Guanylate cyclase domain-containing protein n=1 Tax=Actinomadura rugatobispora TaxID=1994 RepID=A0ABW1ABW0_9ACTN|nr:hypothetical protein GCM10010200_079040 [Actinomadura rugatobispora]
MAARSRLQYRLLVAVDVERYSARDALRQFMAQDDLRHALERAAAGAGLDRELWYRQFAGDGELAVLPGDVDISHAVGALSAELDTALAEINERRAAGDRLRIRLAFHHGTLAPGPFGPAGAAPIVVSRLLDSAPLRALLDRRPEHDLVLAVSDSLYADVVSTGFCRLDPAGFQPIRISAKGIRYRGFIRAGTGARADEALGTVVPLPVPFRPDARGAESVSSA